MAIQRTELPPFSASGNDSIGRRQALGQDLAKNVIERPKACVEFFEEQLSVVSLNKLHGYLWLAGRPMPPRPLTYQLAALRNIVAIEDINLHLTWEPGRIFLKPIPGYLLSAGFWTTHLEFEQPLDIARGQETAAAAAELRRHELFNCARGFLLSYAALIQYESDYHIAVQTHLLPADICWEKWCKTLWRHLENSPQSNAKVNKRYQYGELRLGRLNKISRLRSLLGKGDGFTGLMRGYRFTFATYSQQLKTYLAPIIATTGYIIVVLTAMQVGLATERLNKSDAFQKVSWGFTVFSILSPLILIIIVFILILIYTIFNYRSTKAFKTKIDVVWADWNLEDA